MKRYIACCLGVLLHSAAQSSPYSSVDWSDFVCPVGGERFTKEGFEPPRFKGYDVPVRASEFRRFRERDSDEFAEFPECPSNGLPLYREFTKNELKRLPALLNDPAFIALRKDTQPMRSYWLATRLGNSAETKLVLILPAIELARTLAERKRVVGIVVKAFEIVPFDASFEKQFEAKPSPASKIVVRLVYIDSLRELGLFQRALVELNALPIDQLDGIVPDPVYGPVQQEGETQLQFVLNDSEAGERRFDQAVLAQIPKFEEAIVRRDSTPTLFELLHEYDAVKRCERHNYISLAPSNQKFCNQPPIVVRRKEYAKSQLDAENLRKSAKSSIEAASLVAQCEIADSERERIEKLPTPLSPDDEQTRGRIAVELAACAAIDAM
jgi:hypothetical protein